MKNAQIVGQIFIYVITVIIIGFILVYGYNAIKGFIDRSEQVSFIKFKNDLSNTVEIISPDYGSVKIKSFEVPSDYSKVCFVKNFPDFPSLSGTNYPIMDDSVNSKVQKNVFLIKETVKESFFIGNIDVISDNDKYLCVDVVNNKINNIKFEGKGDHASLSKT